MSAAGDEERPFIACTASGICSLPTACGLTGSTATSNRAKRRREFLAFLRYVRYLHPEQKRLAIILDNFSPHLTTKTERRIGGYATADNIELVYIPFNASWLNRIEAQFTGLRYFALDGTYQGTITKQGRAIRRYIRWRDPTTAAYAQSSTGRTLLDSALDRIKPPQGYRFLSVTRTPSAPRTKKSPATRLVSV